MPSLRLAVAIAILIASNSVQSAETPGARFVGQLNAAITKAAQTSDLSAAARRLCADIAGWLDLGAMMKTASAGATERMNDEQLGAYRAAFLHRIEHECAVKATENLNTGVELAGSRTLATGQIIVGTRSRKQNAGAVMMWQIRQDAGRLAVSDLLIDGRSAVLTLREQAAISLERNPEDISALIASLEH
jgi:hypothetical protein